MNSAVVSDSNNIDAGPPISRPWQNCGTGVSPVVFTVKNAVYNPRFALSLRAVNTTAQGPSVAPVGGCGFRDPVTQGSLRFALGFIPSPLRG